MNQFQFNPINLAIRLESECGRGVNIERAMIEKFGIDRPGDECTNHWGIEIEDEWVKKYVFKRIEEDKIGPFVDLAHIHQGVGDIPNEDDHYSQNPHLEERDEQTTL